ncbi:MAG: flagellar motor protein MotB [Alphaproteobacteria bacterium]|nr:flagellar motor protein MotB [Alphaproteobacteria bacterium]
MSNKPVVIVKRVTGGHDGGHHGGSWKIAYADFVTAMMAFFLLLWLITATTEEQKRGIAEYFTPSAYSTSAAGTSGIIGGSGITERGQADSNSSAPRVVVTVGQPPPGAAEEDTADAEALEELQRQQEEEAFAAAEEAIREATEANPQLEELNDQILIDMTDEGQRIQLIDHDGEAMFDSGSAEPLATTRQVLTKIAEVVKTMPNKLIITGHTDANAFASEDGYTNWELSADRANAARRILVGTGIRSDRLAEVKGKADTEPLVVADPFLPENRRISIVLKREAPAVPE